MSEELGNHWRTQRPPRQSEEDSPKEDREALAIAAQYRLHGNILAQTAISENMRAVTLPSPSGCAAS
jgi:hypothetical protein